jgi:hypothetical protein
MNTLSQGSISSFPAKRFRGEVYRLGHLASFEFSLALDAQASVSVALQVQFSAHCFTERFDAAVHQTEHRYTHLGELRAFNLERYQLSLLLPDLIRSMGQRKVNFTKESNYLLVERVDLQGVRQQYVVFFDLKKAKGGRALRMFVQSAYVKAALPQSLDTIRFRILAAAIWEGRAVHSPQTKQKARAK